jgi:uncharacterized damage-inducible protein DinB
MMAMIQDLVRHKWHANAALIGAIGQHDAAAKDEELRKLLHHILIANRYWLYLILQKESEREEEARIPDGLDGVIAKYKGTEMEELPWLAKCQEADLDRMLHPQSPLLDGQSFSVAEAVMQVCLHSVGHRAQCANRLRALGGTPSNTDFILWLKDRPAAAWPAPQA